MLKHLNLRHVGPAPEIAVQVKARIKEATGLVASVGVAPNKFLAKVASDLEKPDGFVVVGATETLPLRRECAPPDPSREA